MPNALPFERLPTNNAEWVTVYIEGQPVKVRQGDSAAAAVLAAGLQPSRTTVVSGSGRTPYCLMGVCFECLLQIDGVENVQGCMTPAREGMQIMSQKQARQLNDSNPSTLKPDDLKNSHIKKEGTVV
ncbi:(2Fe-2S)-binding protein [Neptunomonas japonica]|uniref:(2Fe-2S)-binding protein n=1 Tax=Neptunomonas japonica TaxID=417574 RepID=UPI000421D65D|nr:(2Fe-2S)-binding protein [Neptunomonas japonica]